MREATVKFKITLEYETTVGECDEDYTLEQEIALQKEYLETQGEDLLDAITNSDLIEVEIISVKEIKEEIVNNFQI